MTPLFRTERRQMPCWQLRQIHAEYRHETSPFEHRQHMFGRNQPSGPSVGIGLRGDDLRANDPRQCRGKSWLGDALSAVREAIRESETGLADPASAGRFHTPTGNAVIHEISSAPQSCSLTAASASQGPPSEFSTYVSDAPADQSQEVLEIDFGVGPGLALSEHGPCVVGGTVTLDDVSFTAKIAMHSGGDVISPHRCVVLFDTGSPQTFIRRTR